MIARKNHICTLCGGMIAAKTDYFFERVTPWAHPDNESYGIFRAHLDCNKIWVQIGAEYEWEIPNPDEFIAEMKEINERKN